MARQKGANNFAGTLEPLAGGPLDARMTVPAKSDLTLSGNFPYPYVGMPVTVQSEGNIYILMDMDYTDIDNWKEIAGGGSGSDNIVEGYFNPSDNLFYEESTYTTAITGADKVIYIALDTEKTYRFNGTIFTRLDEEIFKDIQVTALPTASATEEGKLYQYIGVTDQTYTHGYFYECVEDSGVYSWVRTDTQPQDGSSAVMLNATLLASAWSNKIQTVNVSGLSSTDVGAIGLLETATTAQVEAARQAVITPTAVANGTITFSCENVPDIDIPFGVLTGGGGSSSGATLESAVTANTTVGAITSGMTLAQGTTFTQFVQKLLISEVAPTISFSISKSGNVEYGGSYTETLTLGVTAMGSAKKIKTIAWYQGSTLLQTDTIDSTVTGSWTYTMSTATTDTTTFKAIVTYTKSDDTDTTVTKTSSITFYYKKFYGAVTDINPSEAIVEALSSALATAKGGTYSFTVTAGRICYAYPKSLGALTSIKDGNGFSLFDSFTRTEQSYTQNGTTVDYYRYVLTDATTVSGYSVVFA